MAEMFFYLALGLCLYTYALYPLSIYAAGRLLNRRWKGDAAFEPVVTLIIPAYNEAAVIQSKIENTLASQYPPEKLEIIVASDCSSDQTVRIARASGQGRVLVLDFKERGGKMGTIVKAVAQARGEVLVLTDANAMYAPTTIRELVAPLADPSVGCVCGAKTIVADTLSATDREEKRYWKYESFLKAAESMSGSCVGADGSVYAMRTAQFPDPPTNQLVMDDFIVSLKIILAGSRCVFNGNARAFEGSSADWVREFRRKARILAGALSVIAIIPRILVSSLSFKLVSHKLLRWMTPIFMLVALATSMTLLDRPLFRGYFAVQCLFYLGAAAGFAFECAGRPLPIFKQCFYFSLTAAAQLWGVVVFLRTRKVAHWENLRNHAAKT
jgi:biofilm PGA synthesis N-glycosyltransferase PgaC